MLQFYIINCHIGNENTHICIEMHVVAHNSCTIGWLTNNLVGVPSCFWQHCTCIGINNVCPNRGLNK